MAEFAEQALQVRAACADDLPDMARLFTKHKTSEREVRMARRYQNEPEGWYVAILEGEVVGCCQAVFPMPWDAWLQWMRIAPEMQGTGVGALLIQQVEGRVIQAGAQVLRLSTSIDNDRVHAMMGGSRRYSEWARWTRLTRLQVPQTKSLEPVCPVEMYDKPESFAEVEAWLHKQRGYQMSFRAMTCPSDFKKFISLDLLLANRDDAIWPRFGVAAAKAKSGEIEAVALYAEQKEELRVLQVVAATTSAGLAAVAAAFRVASPKSRLSLQAAGLDAELLQELEAKFRTPATKRQDFYVFGKRVTVNR